MFTNNGVVGIVKFQKELKYYMYHTLFCSTHAQKSIYIYIYIMRILHIRRIHFFL